MKSNKLILVALLFLSQLGLSQIGIGTTSPNAQLDIRSSNQATPSNADGILIPKVDAFPATSPTASQQGMLVYLTTVSGSNSPGFYYWDNPTTAWIGINSTTNGDKDWFKVGTTTSPTAITDDMFHTGNAALGKNTVTNAKLDIENSSVDNSIKNLNNNNSNNVLYGINNAVTGTGTGIHYALYNSLSGTGTGIQYGTMNEITNAFSQNTGTYNLINNNGSNLKIGTQNDITGINNSNQSGVFNYLTTNGNGTHSGTYNQLNSSGTGSRTGVYNLIGGTSTGTVFGTDNEVGNTGTGIHYGSYNSLFGSGTGTVYGNYNNITSTGSSVHYGNYNNMTGSNSADRYGDYTNINSIGATGLSYGSYTTISSSSNSNQYGTYNTLTGSGTGPKYAFYSTIPSSAGGTHYGLYSDVLGGSNYAGYFLGNVSIGTTSANTYTLPASRGTAGQLMRTDGLGNINWANTSDFAWSTTGNTASATDFIGTTNAQPFRIVCNNIERIRINATDGEIITGALASPYAGDLFNAVSTSTLPFALNGYSGQNGSATWGEILTTSSTAFSAVQGVYGGSGVGAGALGNYNGTNTSSTRTGVSGICSTPAATNGGAGVTGFNAIAAGSQHMGVIGSYSGTAFGFGVVGLGFGGGIPTGNNDIGVVGWRTNNANYSGYFNGNHVIANGTKSASVGTSKGNQLLYVTETPEVWFEDLGGGQLINGTAHISLDDMYLETIFVDDSHPMRIFLQEEGESNGLIVIKDADNKGFTVKEKNGGTSTISFSYRIMAKRLHFQDHRFGNDPVWGAGDTRKYNQYASPPPVDYNENIKFQEEQKRNYKPTPMPEGFIDYMTIQKQLQSQETKKTTKK